MQWSIMDLPYGINVISPYQINSNDFKTKPWVLFWGPTEPPAHNIWGTLLLGLLTLYNRTRFLRFVFIFKIVNNQNCLKQLEGYLTSRAELQNRNLRNQGTLDVPQSKTSSGRKTFQIAGASDWNSLPTELRKTTSIGSFKFNLFKQLRDSDISNHKCAVWIFLVFLIVFSGS